LNKIICLLLLLIYCFSLQAKVELIVPHEVINQGAIIKGALRFEGEDLTKVSRLKLTDLVVDDTLYISSSGSVMRSDGAEYLDIPVTFTFIKIPDKSVLEQSMGADLLQIEVSGVQIRPSSAADQFILEEFTIPLKKEWGIYFVGAILFIILTAGGVKLFIYFRNKRKKKKKIEDARGKILKASSYEDVTRVWSERDQLFKLFPESEKSFRDFERVYFQFAFKPTRQESELKIIQEAYAEFLKNFDGGKSGV
jgi:hypothetical protein